jgi:peptidoglycan/LPS O-acetylase OafA/YrhL
MGDGVRQDGRVQDSRLRDERLQHEGPQDSSPQQVGPQYGTPQQDSSPQQVGQEDGRPAEAGVGGPTIGQAGELRSSAVESLRALAALAVLEGHVFGQSRGYGVGAYATVVDRALLGGGMGVYLFFAMTGYLLYRPFARRDLAGGRPIRYGRYAANRAVRILPLYWTVLVVYVVVFDHGGTLTTWWRSLLLVENVFPATLARVDGVMWSLCVEVQFYVLLPMLAWAIARVARGSARRAAGAIVVLGVAAELVRLVTVTLPGAPAARWQYSLPSTFVFFTGGLLLAVVHTAWGERRPSWVRGILAHSDAWLVAGVAVWLVVVWHYDLDVLLVPAGLLVVGSAVLPLRDGVGRGVLRWRPLAVLGVASYSLYLWHFVLVVHLGEQPWMPHGYLALLAIMLPASILVALVSYRVVEAPFLRLRRSWSTPLAVTVPVAAAGPSASSPAGTSPATPMTGGGSA